MHPSSNMLEAGPMPLPGRVMGALTDSRGVGNSSWECSWVEDFRNPSGGRVGVYVYRNLRRAGGLVRPALVRRWSGAGSQREESISEALGISDRTRAREGLGKVRNVLCVGVCSAGGPDHCVYYQYSYDNESALVSVRASQGMARSAHGVCRLP